MKTDLQIQNDVMAELRWVPLLNSSEIGVAVKDGVVTLSGCVDTYTKKIEAQRKAAKVAGVRAVALDLQVGLSPYYKRTDAEIAADVLRTLQVHTSVPDDLIKVRVENGTVTLEGEVEWDYQREVAKDSIQSFAGITNVVNLIKLRPRVLIPDIKQKIKAAFERSAQVDFNRIIVEADGSVVTLTGTVSSLAEKEDAGEAVWSAPGVAKVKNNLEVEPRVHLSKSPEVFF